MIKYTITLSMLGYQHTPNKMLDTPEYMCGHSTVHKSYCPFRNETLGIHFNVMHYFH